MPPKKKLSSSATQGVSGDKNISIGGDVVDSVVVTGDNNTVNQTVIQKFFNIFRSDAETVDQRNRRIMLGHVENFWVKGILEKSLYGAALLDLGIKEDPDALSYPWAIKREANKETLPAGTSMLEIFQEIGMGRSLLILGAPGSGKTTMLLELTRQLIERARQDVTEPIPVVFNLSSWAEKLSLADWLARELNVTYTIPKKVAPTWIKENKMLLLLDGLDEVKQESRDRCVEAINLFRKENGLTSIAVCSRIQDYAELETRLSFDGAIEIQSLTSTQVNNYFKRFGNGLAGIRQILEKDTILREMAETPLFLSIMTLTYRDTQSKDISVSENLEFQRKHLFDTYIERMFERPERSKNERFKKKDVIHWLSWLARKMIENNQMLYLFETMQLGWLDKKKQWVYRFIIGLGAGAIIGSFIGMSFGLIVMRFFSPKVGLTLGIDIGILLWVVFSVLFCFIQEEIEMKDILIWEWKEIDKEVLIIGVIMEGLLFLSAGGSIGLITAPIDGVGFGLIGALIGGITYGLALGLKAKLVSQTTYPGQRLSLTIRNFLFVTLLFWSIIGLGYGLFQGLRLGNSVVGLACAAFIGIMMFGGLDIFKHYILRIIIAFYYYIPFRLIPFLNHCADLIFLRRVGGGYIFVHRLLMEHFAAMYPESEK